MVLRAIASTPNHPDSRRLLAYYTLDLTDAAAEIYRQWLADEPENSLGNKCL